MSWKGYVKHVHKQHQLTYNPNTIQWINLVTNRKQIGAVSKWSADEKDEYIDKYKEKYKKKRTYTKQSNGTPTGFDSSLDHNRT